MRRSDDQPSSRPRRGRRLTAAALAVGLAGAAAATAPPYSITMLTLARD